MDFLKNHPDKKILYIYYSEYMVYHEKNKLVKSFSQICTFSCCPQGDGGCVKNLRQRMWNFKIGLFLLRPVDHCRRYMGGIVLEDRKKEIVEKLGQAMEKLPGDSREVRDLLWEAMRLFQDEAFETAKHLEYTYSIRGNEMFVSRKGKSITRSTVNMAFDKALELKEAGLPITGPKKLGCFGASYLYPVFWAIGVIP